MCLRVCVPACVRVCGSLMKHDVSEGNDGWNVEKFGAVTVGL